MKKPEIFTTDQIAFYYLIKYCIKDQYKNDKYYKFLLDLLCSIYSYLKNNNDIIIWICNLCIILNQRSIAKFNIKLNNKILKYIIENRIEDLAMYFINNINDYKQNFKCIFNNKNLNNEQISYFKKYIINELFTYESIFKKLINDIENLKEINIVCDNDEECILDSGYFNRENDLQICYNDVCLKNSYFNNIESYIDKFDKYELIDNFYTIDYHEDKYKTFKFKTLPILNNFAKNEYINPQTKLIFSEKAKLFIYSRFIKEIMILKYFY